MSHGASAGDVKVDMPPGGSDSIVDVDFKKVSQEEAMKLLKTTHHGLTSAQVEERLKEFGYNKLPESSRNPILVFLSYMWNPLAWAMEVAAIISICLLDYADFALIVTLLLANATISFIEESNADKAIKALAAALAPKAKAFRDGKPINLEAVNLVPGDIVIVMFGNIVPADLKILGDAGDMDSPLQVDQAALTGESLPVKKFPGDVLFSGSTIKQGEKHCVVYATGVNTFFGRAATLLNSTHSTSNIQKVMNRIGGVCLCTIFVWVTIELCVQFGHYHHECHAGEEGCPTLVNMLVIIVGGIPIAMPVVLTVTLALGAAKLAKEGAIVARMSAVEEMASMDVLCSDKTGTLTLNKLSVEPSLAMCGKGMSQADLLRYGALSANIISEEPIDMVLHHSCEEKDTIWQKWTSVKFTPFNPTDKYTINMIKEIGTGNITRVMKGAPQVVIKKAHDFQAIKAEAEDMIKDYAGRGFRALGIAKMDGDGSDPNSKWDFVGLVPLFDPPRHDTKATIDQCRVMGIRVKMITGDQLLIGKETARQLGMGNKLYTTEALMKAKEEKRAIEVVEAADGFAEVFPEHKFEIVEILQSARHICGMTGDGVNDAPALKKADVGIAVAGATDAARGAADIVLTAAGLGTIITAVLGARKIFARMTTYAKYTVSVTIRICFTFGLLTVIYDFYFPTLLIVLLAVFNDGAMIALAKDRVVASPIPTSWNLRNIFITGAVYGLYLTLSSWVMYQVFQKTSMFCNEVDGYCLDDRFKTRMNDCVNRIIPRAFNSLKHDGIATVKEFMSASVCHVESYKAQTAACAVTPSPSDIPTVLEQCLVEQHYVKRGMMRSLLYLQVSVSGQALIFVVRNPKHSLTVVAGRLTYIAFVGAQAASTIIAAFGFGAYVPPKHHFEYCKFCSLSGGATEGDKVHFWEARGMVPIAGSDSVATASVLGCTWYILVAWIWSAIWYVALDPIKWVMMWILDEDGWRTRGVNPPPKPATVEEPAQPEQPAIQRVSLSRRSQITETKKFENDGVVAAPGMVAPSYGNPMGRVSIRPSQDMLSRASVVQVKVDSETQAVTRALESKGLASASQPEISRISRKSAVLPTRTSRTSGGIAE